MKEYIFSVDEVHNEERIDKFLNDELDDLSRSYIQKMINDGNVSINDIPVKKSGLKIKADDTIRLTTPDAVIPGIVAENIPLDILYEDNDVIVVNKPKGVVVHPAPGHYSGTLVNALMYHCKENLSGINGILRPGIVHRIDKDTTGSVIACKNDKAHNIVAKQLKEHSITREYIAIVIGSLPTDHGTINAAIGRSTSDRKKMCINPVSGKNAVTHYDVIERFNGYTYVSCHLETGRTHQIRVHMSSIGHPILGDVLYGGCIGKMPMKLDGQCLHALKLGFVHPQTSEYIETVAPIPEYFEHLLTIL